MLFIDCAIIAHTSKRIFILILDVLFIYEVQFISQNYTFWDFKILIKKMQGPYQSLLNLKAYGYQTKRVSGQKRKIGLNRNMRRLLSLYLLVCMSNETMFLSFLKNVKSCIVNTVSIRHTLRGRRLKFTENCICDIT